MSRFTLPRDIYFGRGSLESLGQIRGRSRAMIVTGGQSMQRFGFIEKIKGALREAGIETRTFEGVEPDPSVETVMRGAEAMREYGPDLIVAVGGGSPIDAAKAMWVFYEHPELSFDDIKKPFSIPPLRGKAIFAAIPSTSGTATEVTAFSVITDYSKKVKYPLADFEITPDIAIVDPELAETMPRELAANTGMDAMTHAIEAYTASLRSPFSDPLALKAIVMVGENLINSLNGNSCAREQMHIAQCLAGMAFSNALLGIVHSLAHKIGAQFNMPHGLCNAVLLPYVMRFNAAECSGRYAEIADALGLGGSTDRLKTESLISFICEINRRAGILPTLADYGVDDEKFNSSVDFISKEAEADPCTGSNPRKASADDLKRILRCALHGEPVNF